MPKHGKNYRNLRAQIDREQLYSPVEAVKLLKSGETAKFDETVEAHFNLGLNVRHAEQQLRGTLMLPHGTGREMRVAVFADGEKAREAQEAGADIVGTNDLASKIEEGFDDFDVAVATPDQMSVVGKLGRILGPRGKMPNPKTGTVTMDVGKAVREANAGKLEYRTDRGASACGSSCVASASASGSASGSSSGAVSPCSSSWRMRASMIPTRSRRGAVNRPTTVVTGPMTAPAS